MLASHKNRTIISVSIFFHFRSNFFRFRIDFHEKENQKGKKKRLRVIIIAWAMNVSNIEHEHRNSRTTKEVKKEKTKTKWFCLGRKAIECELLNETIVILYFFCIAFQFFFVVVVYSVYFEIILSKTSIHRKYCMSASAVQCAHSHFISHENKLTKNKQKNHEANEQNQKKKQVKRFLWIFCICMDAIDNVNIWPLVGRLMYLIHLLKSTQQPFKDDSIKIFDSITYWCGWMWNVEFHSFP